MTLLFLLLTIAPPDTLTLARSYEAAEVHFPLARRITVAEEIAALEIENIEARHLPDLSFEGQGVFHSAVPELPLNVSGSIPRDQYKAAVNVSQVIYDGGARDVSRRLASTSVRTTSGEVGVALHDLKERINDLYFGALLQEAALSTLVVLREEMEARRQALRSQVGQGIAEAGALDVLEVELLSVEQQMTSARRSRRGALDALGVLTGLQISDDVQLALPSVEIRRERGAAAVHREAAARPQYRLFDASREHLSLEREMLGRRRRPVVAGVATAAYGRPAGLDIFETQLRPFYSVGLRVSWTAWDWNISDRDRDVLALRLDAVDAQEEAFTQSIRAAAEREMHEVSRLRDLIDQDREIAALRGRIADRSGRRFENGVISATEYLIERHAERRAELDRERHEIELRYAIVRYLTILGRIDEAL